MASAKLFWVFQRATGAHQKWNTMRNNEIPSQSDNPTTGAVNDNDNGAGRRVAQSPWHTGANHRPHHPTQRRWFQQRMDRIRLSPQVARCFHKDVAELPRSTPHPLLADKPQNLRQPRRPRRLPTLASDRTEKIVSTFMVISCVLRHNRLPFQKFFVTL